ncbi:MAG: histidine ammonia-lyase [Candidatus Eisenbacteria bacterium]
MEPLVLSGEGLTVRGVAEAASREREVRIDPDARGRMERSRALVERAIAEKRVVYGVDTGFGDLAEVSIGGEDLAALQVNLIRSHAAGIGPPLDERATRAILLAKANSLLKGYDGVRFEIPVMLVAFLERGLLPVIPSIGSVGASGDLAPLAHLSLPLIGEGEVWWEGERIPASDGLRRAGIPALELGPKEGLGLVNGTQGMSGILALAADAMENVIEHAVIAAALSTDALRGTDDAFDALLFRVRPHPGGAEVAARLRALLRGSAIRESHRGVPKTQDAYSIRCAPVVVGAARDLLANVRRTVEAELNAATGNPLCFADENRILSGGNFHGEPVALAADFLAIAAAEVGSIAERRVARLVDSKLSGLSPFLARNPGLHSGYMVAQYTAAALVSENKVLAHPASVDSIPTSGNQEDHVSMGFHAARKAREVVENVKRIVAIELLAAAQGIEFLRPLRTSEALEAAIAAIRSAVPSLEEDRPVGPDIERIVQLIDEGTMRGRVRRALPTEG